MRIVARSGLFILLSVVLARCLPAAEQVIYRAVDAENLKDNPEHYWLEPIAFRDELLAPPGTRRITLAGERYVTFKTRIAGRCAASLEVAEKLRSLEVGKSYYFQGTVLAHGRNFHIVVSDVSRSLDVEDAAGSLEKKVGLQSTDGYIRRLLETVESALFTLSQNQGVTMRDLLRPGSEYETQVLETIQSAVLRDSRVSGVTAEMILSRLIYRALVADKVEAPPGTLRTGPLGSAVAASAQESPEAGQREERGPRLRVGVLRVRLESPRARAEPAVPPGR